MLFRSVMIPSDFFAEINHGETAEHCQRDDFLDDLELRGGIDRVPQRLAGTISTYSKNAMPQLTRMATQSGAALCFKWPYQANVMKTFEQVSNTMGSQRD